MFEVIGDIAILANGALIVLMLLVMNCRKHWTR